MLSVEEKSNCEEKDVKLELDYIKIGSMNLFHGEIDLAHKHGNFRLNLSHEDKPIEIKIHLRDLKSVSNQLQDDGIISLMFRPKVIKYIGAIVEQYGFVFRINSSNKSELEFILRFKDLALQHQLFLTDFFNIDIQNCESEVEIVETENADTRPKKKKLYPNETVEFDQEYLKAPKKRQRKIQKSDTIPNNQRRRNSKDQQSRRNSSDQRDENVPPRQEKINTHNGMHDLVQPRATRIKTRANYSEQNNYVLEDISEEQQYQEALRLSLKTLKKENPNGLIFNDSLEKTDMLSFLDVDKNLDLFTYHTSSRGELTVKMEDYLCLSRNEYLSDVDIDFYLQYIYNEKMSTEQQERTYIFGSHFYSLYATSSEFSGWKNNENAGLSASEKRYLRVDGIVGNDINLFEKDFLVFPLMDRNHWFLAIVCFPGLDGVYSMDGRKMPENEIKQPTKVNGVLVPVKVPSVLIFDSISGNVARRTIAMNHIKTFLKTEYEHKYKHITDFKKSDLIGHAAHCPLQLNNYDCGCFLLEFFERFFVKSPLESFRTPLDLVNWFDPENLGRDKRHEVAEAFKLMMGDSQISLPEIEFNSSSPGKKVDIMNLEENDTSNNNDNNAIGNEEFNNNNFNCPDINGSLQQQDQNASSQLSIITVSSSTNIEESEKNFDKESPISNEGEKKIQENINELMNNINSKNEEATEAVEKDDEDLSFDSCNNRKSKEINPDESIVVSD